MEGRQVEKIMEIPGKHGTIRLVIPENKPTVEELQSLHRLIAETMVRTSKIEQQHHEKEKTTNLE
jgi:hypothetical protein